MPNIIYVLTNEAMPGIVKVGLSTDSVEARITQLSSATGVPLPFECYFAAEVEDCSKLERTLHQLFSENRVNPKREFFKIDPEKVVLAISIGDFKEITPGMIAMDKEERDALDKAKARAPRLRLDAIGINPGDVLTLSRDEKLTATVVEGNKVEFEGETLSLSAAAMKALRSLGYESGTATWMFEGETLAEIRQKMESAQFDSPTNS
jgi:hypothetical protein